VVEEVVVWVEPVAAEVVEEVVVVEVAVEEVVEVQPRPES
jgi:hypothetical protein